MEMQAQAMPPRPRREPWNKGKLIGQKPPLRPKHVWSIRTRLQMEGRTRDLAMFNLAIDSKLRGCDVVALRVEDVAPSGYAVDRAPSNPDVNSEISPDITRRQRRMKLLPAVMTPQIELSRPSCRYGFSPRHGDPGPPQAGEAEDGP